MSNIAEHHSPALIEEDKKDDEELTRRGTAIATSDSGEDDTFELPADSIAPPPVEEPVSRYQIQVQLNVSALCAAWSLASLSSSQGSPAAARPSSAAQTTSRNSFRVAHLHKPSSFLIRGDYAQPPPMIAEHPLIIISARALRISVRIRPRLRFC